MALRKAQSFPLRLGDHVREQAMQLAQSEGISLNQFISLALAEKISRMEHENWLARPPLHDTRPNAAPAAGKHQAAAMNPRSH